MLSILKPDGQPPTAAIRVGVKPQTVLLTPPLNSELAPEATLSLSPVAGDETLQAKDGVKIVSDLGPVEIADGADGAISIKKPTGAMLWLIVEWSAPRAVNGVHIVATSGQKVRLKSWNGGWLPLYPVDTLKTGAMGRLPPFTTQKLMIEAGNPNQYGAWVGAARAIRALTISVARQPTDLVATLGDDNARLESPGLLDAAAEIPDFAAACNNWLRGHPGEREIPLTLHAAAAGEIKIDSSKATLLHIVEHPAFTPHPPPPEWSAPPEQEKEKEPPPPTLLWGSALHAAFPLAEKGDIRALQFECAPEWKRERLWTAPSLAVDEKRGQLCDAEHWVAQSFGALPEGEGLCAIELALRPLTTPLTLHCALHPDRGGRPAPKPYAEMEWQREIAEAPFNALSGWLRFALDSPSALADPWWIVVGCEQGAAFWPLSARPQTDEKKIGAVLRRQGADEWQSPRTTVNTVWAPTRLLLAAPEAASKLTLTLTRGEKEVVISLPNPPRFAVDWNSKEQTVLNTLNEDNNAMLTARLTAEGSGQIKALKAVCRYSED